MQKNINIVVSIPDIADQTIHPVNAVRRAMKSEINSGVIFDELSKPFKELSFFKTSKEILYINMHESR